MARNLHIAVFDTAEENTYKSEGENSGYNKISTSATPMDGIRKVRDAVLNPSQVDTLYIIEICNDNSTPQIRKLQSLYNAKERLDSKSDLLITCNEETLKIAKEWKMNAMSIDNREEIRKYIKDNFSP